MCKRAWPVKDAAAPAPYRTQVRRERRMRVHRLFLHLVWAVLLAGLASAGQAAEPLSPAKVLSYVRANDLRLSPDGSKLAYVANSYAWDAKSHLRVLDLATG